MGVLFRTAPWSLSMVNIKLLLCVAVCAVTSNQATHYCPDGWVVSQIDDKIECLLLGGVTEMVTNVDAAIICQFHGGWLVNMDGDNGPAKNNFIKSLISDADGPGGIGIPGMQYSTQWWLGAHVSGPHGDHNWGHWTWDQTGVEVTWFDWMRNEPNDWHGQNCLTFLKDQNMFGSGVYHWNDWDCNSAARYICQKTPDQEIPSTTSTTTATTSVTSTTTTTSGPQDCPFTSHHSLPSRSLFCPQSYCPAVLISSQGGAKEQQPDSLGCYNYEGSLLGDEYPNYIQRNGLFLTPGEHTSPMIGYTTWIVSTEVLAGTGTIRNIKHDTVTCPYDIHDGWQYWDETRGRWVEDQTLSVTCPGHL